MGYFANGSEGDGYYEQWCENCLHCPPNDSEENCAVLAAHQIYNYDDCNNPDSILHILIPRDEKGYNQKCEMFLPKDLSDD